MRVFVFTFVNTCKCILHTYAAFKQIHTATLPSMIDILSTKTLMSSTRIAVVPQKPAIVGGWTNPSEKYARQIGSFPQSLNHHQDILLESHHEYLLRTVRFGLVFLLARLGFSKKNIWNHHLVSYFHVWWAPPTVITWVVMAMPGGSWRIFDCPKDQRLDPPMGSGEWTCITQGYIGPQNDAGFEGSGYLGCWKNTGLPVVICTITIL